MHSVSHECLAAADDDAISTGFLVDINEADHLRNKRQGGRRFRHGRGRSGDHGRYGERGDLF